MSESSLPLAAERQAGVAPDKCSTGSAYRGRFAPSPTGPLHAGSLVAALASWLDARVHRGDWLLRIEDIDTPRCSQQSVRTIARQLAAFGLLADAPPMRQADRGASYQAAIDHLAARGRVYACGCTRRDIERHWAERGVVRPAGVELPYPGTCRPGLLGRPARALRLRLPPGDAARVHWQDRRLGAQLQDVSAVVGDFVLRRADGLWAYQLAVVVDDAAQGISDVVRGADLADNTARQILLQRALGLSTPRYLHTPLVLAADGLKLSKQNGATALDPAAALPCLRDAATRLGLHSRALAAAVDVRVWLRAAVAAWAGIIESFQHQEKAR